MGMRGMHMGVHLGTIIRYGFDQHLVRTGMVNLAFLVIFQQAYTHSGVRLPAATRTVTRLCF